jgi:transcriptional regulator with XRE-family HTH domain
LAFFVLVKEKRKERWSMHESPVRRVRREMGLSQIEFAALCGVSHGAVTFVESGVGALPRAIAETLAACGFDTARLAAEHEAFRRARAVELAERVQSRKREGVEV